LHKVDIQFNRLETALEVRAKKESTTTINQILKKLNDSYIIEVDPIKPL